MTDKLTRRSFLSSSLYGVGGMVALGNLTSFTTLSETNPFESGEKMLMATTDYTDNIIINHNGSRYGTPVPRDEDYYRQNKCFFNKEQLDGLHKFLASIGVKRHQWIIDTYWNLYEDYPHGFDLLEEAAKSAHKYGIEFYAEIKPFEGGGFGAILPSTMPVPEGAVAYKDIRGIFPIVRPFVAANPDKTLKRNPAVTPKRKTISAIRLVKGDHRETRIKKEHLSIFTSASNNNFKPYQGTFSFRVSMEKRYRFPYWRECRILHLENLEIPKGHNYVLIKCSLADEQGNFSNEKGNIVELVEPDNEILPHTLSTGPITLEEHNNTFYHSKIRRQIMRYFQMPEVIKEINDPDKMKYHYRDYYAFGDYNEADYTTLDKEGYLAFVQGKPEYLPGHLNPIYPEVREHWLGMVRFCLDRGVDGINFRGSNHAHLPDYWNYGYNEPSVKACNGKVDYTTLSRVNGDAYTTFLREARKLIKSEGKNITIHLLSNLIMPDNRPNKLPSLPPNIQWQWKTWVKEIADELEFRGVFKVRPENLDRILNIFATAAENANKPFYFQGDFHGVAFERPFLSTESELQMVKGNDEIKGYVLYETANFTRINEEGKIEGSPELLKVLKTLND